MKMGAVLSILLFSVSVVQAQEVWPYHESFETGYGRWSTPATSYRQWYRQYGYSSYYYWYYGTGPSGAHDRDYYCYVSSSSSSILQNVEMVATFDLTALANPILTFRYHMHGSDMGAMKVEAKEGSGDWMELMTISGQKQGESYSPWGKDEADLTNYKSAATQIRFTGTTGTGYSSDIGLDDIWIYDKQELPANFEWTAIDDRQTNGVSFPVQVTAQNSSGNPLTSFSGPVELTAWSDGFGNVCQNGDFESWPTDLWTPYTNAVSSGDAIIVESVYGSGYAVAFNPDAEDDGLSQVINVSGGELYYVSAKYTFRNAGDSSVSGNFSAKILVDGVAVASSYESILYDWNIYSYQLSGYFVVPESEQEGTRTISIVAASGNPVDDDIWISFDDVSVNFAPEQYLDVSPGTSGEFTNGVWNGTVAMDYRLPNIHLIARYGDVIGHSGIFTTYVSAYDMDYDGMVDNWERLYFSSTEACDAETDPDKDGYSNVDEFIIGTNPILGDSHLAFRTRVSGEKCIMDWYANETCTYDVEWTPNLKYTDFTMIAEDVPYTQASFTNDLSNVGFYRINVHKK